MNYFSKIKLLIAGIIYTTISFGLVGCSDDDNGPNLITDKNSISDAIKIPGAVKIQGVPPATSTDVNAPQIHEDHEDLKIIQGKSIVIDLSVWNGTAAGIYFKVEGSNSYYDIKSSSFASKGGRFLKTTRTQESDPAFVLELPSNITPGPLCVEYCVYDEENRVSNVISRCIVVEKLGGAGSEYLTASQWSVGTIILEYDNEVETIEVGEPNVFTLDVDIYCSTSEEYISMPAEFESTIEYVFISVEKNGNAALSQSSLQRNPDFDNSDCELVYEEYNTSETSTGAWSYNHDLRKLTLILNFEDEEDTYTEFYDFTIAETEFGYIWAAQFEDESVTLLVSAK